MNRTVDQFASSQDTTNPAAVQADRNIPRSIRLPVSQAVFLLCLALVLLAAALFAGFGYGVYYERSTTDSISAAPTVSPTADPQPLIVPQSPSPEGEVALPSAEPPPTWTLVAPQPESTYTPQPTATPMPGLFEGPIEYGRSVNGFPLEAYRLGNGESARAIIGGIHGGYELNTIELVSDTLDYLQTYTTEIPANVTLYLIPDMNPDGYAADTSAEVGRMNGNLVDLNRNWGYQWQMTATHGIRPVKAGTGPFSEPETAATRDFIINNDIELVIFYHSAMGVVFSGADRDHSATYELAELLSDATGYRHQTEGIAGQITTGDAIDYLSTIGIAAAEIELATHDPVSEPEWQRNLAGIRAFLNWTIPDVGQAVPEDAPPQNGAWEYEKHVIQSGDGLYSIAEKYRFGTDSANYAEMLRVNDIDETSLLGEGDELLIPVRTSSP